MRNTTLRKISKKMPKKTLSKAVKEFKKVTVIPKFRGKQVYFIYILVFIFILMNLTKVINKFLKGGLL